MEMHICLNRATAGASLPYDEFVKLAADAGFEGADVEPGWARMHSVGAMRDLFASRNLRFGGWGVPFDWRGDDESKRRDGINDLRQFAGYARELDIDACATWIMPSSDRPLIENWNFHVERLKPVARVLADHGLRLGLEFVAPYHLRRHFKHEFIFTPGQMLELAADVGENVGLLVDSFHVNAAGSTWEEISKLPASKIVHVHINDAPEVRLHQLVDDQRLLPGEGALSLRSFLGSLRTAGYNGPVSLEVFSDALKRLDPHDAARRAWTATQATLKGTEIA
jgi:sugar phosphate isomerase/epimerase